MPRGLLRGHRGLIGAATGYLLLMYVADDLNSFAHAASDVAFVLPCVLQVVPGAPPASGSAVVPVKTVAAARSLASSGCSQACRPWRAAARVLTTRRCVGAAGRAAGFVECAARYVSAPPRTRRPWGPSHVDALCFLDAHCPLSPAGASGLSPRRAWRGPRALRPMAPGLRGVPGRVARVLGPHGAVHERGLGSVQHQVRRAVAACLRVVRGAPVPDPSVVFPFPTHACAPAPRRPRGLPRRSGPTYRLLRTP